MKVKGKSLMIRVAGHTIALATNCSFEASLNTLDARTKADNGANDVPDDYTWSISSDSILGLNPGTEQHTYATLMRLFLQKKPVDVEVFLASGIDSAVPAGDWVPGPSKIKGFAPYGGEAILKNISITGGVSDKAKISVQLAGQGELRELEYPLTATVDGNILILNGPAEITNEGILCADKGIEITDKNIVIQNS